MATARRADDVLRRWEEFGGTWRVLSRTPTHVTVSLCRCDGGEEVEQLTSADAALPSYIGRRTTSSDDQRPPCTSVTKRPG